jgi:peptide/nickel transport system permease protein
MRGGQLARRNPNMAVGIAIVVALAFVSLIAPLITSVSPTAINMSERLVGPSSGHWFGTDGFGRDVYTRTVYGGRVSLLVGFTVALITITAGAAIGALAGYFRKVDAVAMRILDGIMAIPTVLLAIALVATLGASVQNVIVALAIVDTPRAVRVARASVLSLREQAFVDGAKAIGAGHARILLRHIIPNLIAPLIVMGTYIAAAAILTEATLSFLGAGTPPTTPSWGNIMAEGRGFIHKAMWVIFFPGLVLAIAVTAVNLAGDGLRDILDPKLSRRA